MLRSVVFLCAVVGCSDQAAPPPPAASPWSAPAPAPTPAPQVTRGNAGGETNEHIAAEAEALEAAAQRGDVQWTTTEGHDLITIDGSGAHTQPFPAPKFGHGDELSATWLAPDGTLFTVGSMITGAPGPDTGAIHRMAPGGKLERVFETKERELYDVWGRTANDVYAVGPKIIVHWDGHAWTELSRAGVEGTLAHVTGTATDVWIAGVDNQPEQTWIYRLAGGQWKQEAHFDCMVRGLAAATSVVYASGACDAVFRRTPDATWSTETVPATGAFQVAAVSDSVAYVAAADLIHRRPDGSWVKDKTELSRIFEVAPARGGQVFAVGNLVGTSGDFGLLRGTAAKFTKLRGDNCSHPVGGDSLVYCVHERTIAALPPADLRKR